MEIPDSNRSAFVTTAEGKHGVIQANEPSDLMELKRNHIQLKSIDGLRVLIGFALTSSLYGSPKSVSSEVWKQAIHHLLETYHPMECFFHVKNCQSDIDDHVGLEDGTSYQGFWNAQRTILSFKK